LRKILYEVFKRLGPKKRVLALPPDFTRFHSFAGQITEMVWDYYGKTLTDVMPGQLLLLQNKTLGLAHKIQNKIVLVNISRRFSVRTITIHCYRGFKNFQKIGTK
jgi:hypothetical protein